MNETNKTLWERYQRDLVTVPSLGLSLDASRMRYDETDLARLAAPMHSALLAMEALEHGSIANPDEKRMVGHYWLRNPALAPSPDIRRAIETTLARVTEFAAEVHAGRVRPIEQEAFRNLLVIGIGGSALGPELVSAALGGANDRMRAFFFDNTDPDGMDRTLDAIGDGLGATLTVVISKSGGTKETRNGMLEAKAAYVRAGLDFARHAVAVTGEGSLLDQTAKSEGFLATFPMWDWVGGRTSELSAVGLLPAALQGIDVLGMVRGAAEMDEVTRSRDPSKNPAARLATMWHIAGRGRGEKSMVVIPYRDRLELFSRYLQQLVMESIGKEKDTEGRTVLQGITVYGNKGSTDQHAYVQQLRDGLANFFVTFVRVLEERDPARAVLEVEPGVTSGDYLEGFWLGTRQALFDNGRDSITITLSKLDARSLGALIALYERAVGLYASLVQINAYDQPGVEAGKKAAAHVLSLQQRLLAVLSPEPLGPAELAQRMGSPDDAETVHHLLEHLSRSARRGVERVGEGPLGARYKKVPAKH
jgi:glucose-6-phosphate isomerase